MERGIQNKYLSIFPPIENTTICNTEDGAQERKFALMTLKRLVDYLEAKDICKFCPDFFL